MIVQMLIPTSQESNRFKFFLCSDGNDLQYFILTGDFIGRAIYKTKGQLILGKI